MDMQSIMKNQPIVNIGIIGHVSNGKSSVTKCLTGIATQKHSDEKKRNIPIKLGYANAKIYKCSTCIEPLCYKSTSMDYCVCEHCNIDMELVNHISICDVPGHNLFMSAMMNGTNVMDYTVLIESITNTDIPAIQTKEHLLCTDISKIPNIATCVNKLDLIKKEDACVYISKLKKQLIGTQAEKSPIIPISASLELNIDVLTQILANIKPNNINLSDDVNMLIIRSFNINKCGANINNLKGGVIGGSIIRGMLKMNDTIIIKPGYVVKNNITRFKYMPLTSRILSINSEKTILKSAISGGLIGVMLDIDPGLTCDDGIVGSMLLNEHDTKNEVFIKLNYHLTKTNTSPSGAQLAFVLLYKQYSNS